MSIGKNIYVLGMLFAVAALLFVMQTSIFAQIRLNEVEIDAPDNISEGCEYAEIKGTAGSFAPAGTFFLSIDGDSGQGGNVNYVGDIGGVQFGTNGTITIITNSDVCLGRVFPAGTTVVESNSLVMGFGAETYIVATSGQPSQIFEGQDLDQNSDGQLDAAFQITPIDGFGFVVNPTFNSVYGGAPVIFSGLTGGLDLPDAVTRFSGNNNFSNFAPLDINSFYYGEIAGTGSSTTYQAPLSANFPVGGMLTPGAPNVPLAPTAANVSISGRVINGVRGISRAVVLLTDDNGNVRRATTNPFGYFRFDEVESGRIYVVSVASKTHSFSPQTITAEENISDLVFQPNPLLKPLNFITF
jgi:hypothetical protein